VPPELLGPLGVTVGALIVAGVLWRDHLRSDAEDRAQRDEWKTSAQELLKSIPALVAGVDKLRETVHDMDLRRAQGTSDAVEQVLKRIEQAARK